MRKYEAPCCICGRMLPGTPNSLPAGQRTCRNCREAGLNPALWMTCVTCGTWFAAYQPGAKYCGESCKPYPAPPPAPRRKECPTCGREFISHDGQKYCNQLCRPRQKATGPPCPEPGCGRPSRKRGWCCTHYNRRYQPNRSHGPVPIAEWVKQNPERAARSSEAKTRRRRARLQEAASEPYTLAEIAARDKFICQLCHKRVAMTKVVPHPRAPTIDHRVPLVESLDDTRANVQLAHFVCNCRKGARGGPEQLALFG
jgi:HNH endonuclease